MNESKAPVPGDIVWADRIVYKHCGIYIGEGRVIHFAAPEGSEINEENAVVHETSYEEFSDGCPVTVYPVQGGYPAEETIARAKSQIGKKGYDFLLSNCDHFAMWCKTGEHRSVQVEKAVDKLLEGLKVVFENVREKVKDIFPVKLSYKEVMEYFSQHKDDSPEIVKGAILKEDVAGGGFLIIQAFLDKDNNPVIDSSGQPLGIKIKASQLDDELLQLFKDASVVIVE